MPRWRAGRWARISASPIAPRRRRCSTAAWWCRSSEDAEKSCAPISERLKARPSFARVMKEAEPYFQMVPKDAGGALNGQKQTGRDDPPDLRSLSRQRSQVRRGRAQRRFPLHQPLTMNIDKPAYFERCWKNSDWIERHELEQIFVEGDEAFVTYRCVAKGGKGVSQYRVLRLRRRQGEAHRRLFRCGLRQRRVRQTARARLRGCGP